MSPPLAPVEVVGIGAATWDNFWLVQEFSACEGVRQAEATAAMGGGPVATALCVLRHLGRSCALIDSQGDDDSGRAILADLATSGIGTSHIRTHPGARSARATILVRQSDGARQIVYAPATVPALAWNDSDAELLRHATLLHINGRHPEACAAAIELARPLGLTISFDGGAGRYHDGLRHLVAASHLRIFSRDFAERLTGHTAIPDMLRTLLEPPAQLAVVTDGAAGSWVALPGGAIHHQPAIPSPQVVDTTGCGDVYHGAFLHAWLAQRPLPECARFAAELASANTEGLGGRYVMRSAFPNPDANHRSGEKSVGFM